MISAISSLFSILSLMALTFGSFDLHAGGASDNLPKISVTGFRFDELKKLMASVENDSDVPVKFRPDVEVSISEPAGKRWGEDRWGDNEFPPQDDEVHFVVVFMNYDKELADINGSYMKGPSTEIASGQKEDVTIDLSRNRPLFNQFNKATIEVTYHNQVLSSAGIQRVNGLWKTDAEGNGTNTKNH